MADKPKRPPRTKKLTPLDFTPESNAQDADATSFFKLPTTDGTPENQTPPLNAPSTPPPPNPNPPQQSFRQVQPQHRHHNTNPYSSNPNYVHQRQQGAENRQHNQAHYRQGQPNPNQHLQQQQGYSHHRHAQHAQHQSGATSQPNPKRIGIGARHEIEQNAPTYRLENDKEPPPKSTNRNYIVLLAAYGMLCLTLLICMFVILDINIEDEDSPSNTVAQANQRSSMAKQRLLERRKVQKDESAIIEDERDKDNDHLRRETIEQDQVFDDFQIEKIKRKGPLPKNFHKTVGNNNFRSAAIRTIEELKNIKEQYGVEIIVNLSKDAMFKQKCSGKGYCEPKWAKKLGLTYVSAYMYDEGPKPDEWEDIKDAMDAGNALIHCTHGADRTGAVIGRFRLERSTIATEEQVLKEQLHYGFKKKTHPGYGRGPDPNRKLREWMLDPDERPTLKPKVKKPRRSVVKKTLKKIKSEDSSPWIMPLIVFGIFAWILIMGGIFYHLKNRKKSNS